MKADLTEIQGLYRKYAADLKRVRQEQLEFYRQSGEVSSRSEPLPVKLSAISNRVKAYLSRGALLKPQLDDLEAEITYLRLREYKPQTVVEISPCGGWSSTWILQALKDNGFGQLHSYDLVNTATRNVPASLAQGRWHFHQGDVTKNMDSLPAKIDYLFIDSDHSAQFADWYISKLFTRLKAGTPVSVHDVFHTAHPSGFDHEGGVIMSWIDGQRIPYFTASGAKAPHHENELMKLKADLGISNTIHRSKNNSMVFFEYASK